MSAFPGSCSCCGGYDCAGDAGSDPFFEDWSSIPAPGGLDYDLAATTDWEVTVNSIDAIGADTPFDIIPGHGRYLDLAGTIGVGGAKHGTIRTKQPLDLRDDYLLLVELAGSNRQDLFLNYHNVTISIGGPKLFIPILGNRPFRCYGVLLPAGEFDHLEIALSPPVGPVGNPEYGPLLRRVRIAAIPPP